MTKHNTAQHTHLADQTMRITHSSAKARSSTRVRAASVAVALTAALGVWLGLLAGAASAAQTYNLVGSFGSFSNPNGVAVDSSGDVYVADIATSSVQKFDASGNPVNFSSLGSNTLTGSATPATSFSFSNQYGNPAAIAVDNSTSSSAGDLYVMDLNHRVVDKFDSTGAYVGQITGTPSKAFSSLQGIGVDGAGNLWAYQEEPGFNGDQGEIDEFGPSGSFLFSNVINQTDPGFAVDPAGDQYPLTASNTVAKYAPSGTRLGTVDPNTGQDVAVAVDPATGYVFIDRRTLVGVYDTSAMNSTQSVAGTLVAQFGSQQLTGSTQGGLAVSPASGNVYVANPANGKIEIYALVTIPDVTTGQASNLTQTGATLSGTVNPDGIQVSDCHFDYGTTTAYGQTAACVETVGSGTGNVSVHADLTGLTQQTTYHFRLEATNANGTNFGSDQTFTTTGPPTVDGESATPAVADTSEILHAQINPFGLVTSYHFEYGTTTAYGTSAPVPDGSIPAEVGDQALSTQIDGLALNTTYHYRVVATNSAGTTDGPDQTFTTPKGFGIASFDGSVINQDGSVDTQAGSHPWALTTSFSFNTRTDAGGKLVPDGQAKDIQVDLPAGLVGDPSATPQCPPSDFTGTGGCSPDTQVGVVTLTTSDTFAGQLCTGGYIGTCDHALYNLVPPKGMPAELGFTVANVPVRVEFSVRTGGDYGLTTTLNDVPQTIPLVAQSLTVWGVPTDPSHDAQRCNDNQLDNNNLCRNGGNPSGAPAKPFMTLPSACNGPQTTYLKVDSWDSPGAFKTASFVSHDNSGSQVRNDGCNRLDFSPSITVKPDTTVADSPSGLSVDLHLPQNDNPLGLAEADLKTAVVTLPQGVSVDPSSANGLGACSPSQIGLSSPDQPSCPDSSKIGSVEVDTPLLPNPLKGWVYLAQQSQNPFGSLLAIYVTAFDPVSGVLVKLAGHVVPDPVTGQLTTTFDNNPQLPFSDFKLDFFGGPHGPLATPESCGSFTTSTSMTPWSAPGSGPAATPSDSFQVNSGCVSGFSPSFAAGTQNAQAGAYSPFVLSFGRSDTDQELSGLAVKLPEGMLAKLAGVQQCSEQQLAAISSQPGTAAQQAANPSCPAGSQVGTVTTGAGPGSDPFFLSGKAYLTGPYKGAPYGLAVVVPALAGPFDLGTVAVRQALYVDPETAQVTAVSDPFPTILDGIPLRLRRVDVNLNRPDFTVNPTSCDPMQVGGILSSTGGLTAGVSSRFQVGGCQALGFTPRLSVSLTGKGRTHSGDHPNLTATLTQPAGQANIKSAKVALPLSLALDPNNSQHVCSYDVAQKVHGGAVGCPASTIVGEAIAQTPLLDRPLTGPVYLVQGIRFGKNGQRIRTLPSLLVPLRGQIALDLRASSSVNGAQQLVTTFSTIPDAPVSKFTLQINGGPKGILVITGRGQTICGSPQVANASFGAQSGKTNGQNDTMATPCGQAAGLRHTAVKRDTVRVTVHVPGPGRLRASGQWLKSQTRLFGRAQTATLDLHLTEAAMHHKHHLQTQVMLDWTPAGGGTYPMQTRTLTIRR